MTSQSGFDCDFEGMELDLSYTLSLSAECYLMLLVMEEKWTSHLFEVTIKI